jgi:hypothetical protein
MTRVEKILRDGKHKDEGAYFAFWDEKGEELARSMRAYLFQAKGHDLRDRVVSSIRVVDLERPPETKRVAVRQWGERELEIKVVELSEFGELMVIGGQRTPRGVPVDKLEDKEMGGYGLILSDLARIDDKDLITSEPKLWESAAGLLIAHYETENDRLSLLCQPLEEGLERSDLTVV